MNEQRFCEWIDELKRKVPVFVNNMKNAEQPGRYRLSWSGDIVPAHIHWGLAQTTFATRVLLILDTLTNTARHDLTKYILSFSHRNGLIYDEYVQKVTRYQRWFNGIKQRKLDILLNKPNKWAETRQAYAALINLGSKLNRTFHIIELDKTSIKKYINRLDWNNPWGAASCVNHLVFFIHFGSTISEGRKQEFFNYIEQCLKPFQRDDGGFYLKNSQTRTNQKIGSTMKILMGISLIGREYNWIQESHIDLALDSTHENNDACINFNTIYVLTKALEHTSYRQEEAINFLFRAISVWKKDYYWKKLGAFSFYKGRATSNYYGAQITRGLSEPDLHGTAMFCWGIYIIAKALKIHEECGLREPVL